MSFLARLFKRKSSSSVDGIFADIVETPETPVKQEKSPKKSKPAKSSSMDATALELIANDDGTVVIGFGMRWRKLVTSGGRDAAQTMAQNSKATHYIFRSQQVGYGLLPKQIQGQIYPAALLAAKAHSGAAVFALTLGQGQYWFAIVRNGQPTNTDEVISDLPEPQAVARIRAIVQQFEGETIAIFSDIQNSGIDAQRPFTLHDLFDVVRTDEDRLQKLKDKKGAIPKPMLYAGLVSILALSAQRGFVEWRAYQQRKDLEANKVVELTPEAAWAPVLAKFLSSTPKPNTIAVTEIRKSISALPVVWAGWVLTGTRCQAAAEVNPQKNRPWSCQATYDRSRVADTSEKILQKVKARNADWAVVFPTINTMMLSWSISHQEEPIALTDMLDPNGTTIAVASKLQDYFPALATRPEFAMTPFELPAPKRKDGTPHPKPEPFPALFKGDLTLKGPLRSIDALSQNLPNVEWDALGLLFDMKSPPAQKGLTTSSLTVELTGKVFGKK